MMEIGIYGTIKLPYERSESVFLRSTDSSARHRRGACLLRSLGLIDGHCHAISAAEKGFRLCVCAPFTDV